MRKLFSKAINMTGKISTTKLYFILAIILLFAYSATSYNYAHNTTEYQTVLVVDKERICSSGDNCRWLVFTENEVFENTDSLFHLKWNSTDLQHQITVGETYTFLVYGWRIPFLSMHRNIVRTVPSNGE